MLEESLRRVPWVHLMNKNQSKKHPSLKVSRRNACRRSSLQDWTGTSQQCNAVTRTHTALKLLMARSQPIEIRRLNRRLWWIITADILKVQIKETIRRLNQGSEINKIKRCLLRASYRCWATKRARHKILIAKLRVRKWLKQGKSVYTGQRTRQIA